MLMRRALNDSMLQESLSQAHAEVAKLKKEGAELKTQLVNAEARFNMTQTEVSVASEPTCSYVLCLAQWNSLITQRTQEAADEHSRLQQQIKAAEQTVQQLNSTIADVSV